MERKSLTLSAICAASLYAGAVYASNVGGLPECKANLTNIQGLLNTCQTDLTMCQSKSTVILPGDGVNGPALSYTDNADGTFTDNNTLLMWEEKKPGSGDVHDVSNLYTWSSSGTVADGTVFTDFLATLNTSPCFASHCDWRLPSIKELVSLVDYGQFNLAIAPSVAGATQSGFYWSATTFASDPVSAWGVNFVGGLGGIDGKTASVYARAVRSGL